MFGNPSRNALAYAHPVFFLKFPARLSKRDLEHEFLVFLLVEQEGAGLGIHYILYNLHNERQQFGHIERRINNAVDLHKPAEIIYLLFQILQIVRFRSLVFPLIHVCASTPCAQPPGIIFGMRCLKTVFYFSPYGNTPVPHDATTGQYL